MRIYKAEKEAGIESQMNGAGSSTAFVTAQVQVGDIEKYFDGMSVSDLMGATSTVQTVEELLGQKQPDLSLVVAILVSTGWNLNDDIFTPDEVWRAKSSPLHKPMNDNHQADKILGHIVETRVLDKSGNEITVVENESPPAEFDIEVAGVLYRAFPELSERIDEIIAKAKAGEMFVSMEAWFPDFGYGMIDSSTGETKFIDRNESTAFLTKHLKIYGGCGEYQGYRIGRVLKDIIFGAQGFVDEPANPESVIKVAAVKAAVSKFNGLLEGGVEDVDKESKELQTKPEEAKGKEVADLQKVAEESKTKDYDGQITALTVKVEELTTSMDEASEKMKVVETAKVGLQKQLDEVTQRAEKGEMELEGIRKTEKARERLTKLSGVKNIDDEKATLAEFCEMTDETFEMIMKYAGEARTEKVVDDVKAEVETVDEKDVDKSNAALDNVEVNDTADFNVSKDNGELEADRWLTTAKALCGRRDKKDEGGE